MNWTHDQLQIAFVKEFGPRFIQEPRLIYLGATPNELHVPKFSGIEKSGIPIQSYDKLPDIILYDEVRHWSFLIEAVVSDDSPISTKRRLELERAFEKYLENRIYISAFPSFSHMKEFVTEIAWDTEVWLAEIPDHLIHFNGDRFLGPRRGQ